MSVSYLQRCKLEGYVIAARSLCRQWVAMAPAIMDSGFSAPETQALILRYAQPLPVIFIPGTDLILSNWVLGTSLCIPV
jgi:hypothetical protein